MISPVINDLTITKRSYLFVLPWSLDHVGGVNQVVINLAHEMRSEGSLQPIVLITDWQAPSPIFGESHGIRTVRWRIRGIRPDMGLKERLAFSLWESRFRHDFLNFCRTFNVSVVNPHYVGPSSLTIERVVSKIDSRIPVLFSFHGSDIATIDSEPLTVKLLWQETLSRRQSAIACSKDLQRRIREALGDNIQPHVVYNGINVETFWASAQDRGSAGKEKIILNVGKFEHKKGQDILIQAFANIAADYPDTRLVLLGATDRELPALKKLCEIKEVAERVSFFPDVPHSRIADFYNNATIFVLPSRQEALGLVLLEAGAFALPVIASKVGGIPEVITDGVTGRLVTAEHVEELACCLKSLLDSPDTSKRMGERLHQHVKENFSWRLAMQKYLDLSRRLSKDSDLNLETTG